MRESLLEECQCIKNILEMLWSYLKTLSQYIMSLNNTRWVICFFGNYLLHSLCHWSSLFFCMYQKTNSTIRTWKRRSIINCSYQNVQDLLHPLIRALTFCWTFFRSSSKYHNFFWVSKFFPLCSGLDLIILFCIFEHAFNYSFIHCYHQNLKGIVLKPILVKHFYHIFLLSFIHLASVS